MRDHRYHGHHSLVQAHGAFSRLSSGHRGFGRLGQRPGVLAGRHTSVLAFVFVSAAIDEALRRYTAVRAASNRRSRCDDVRLSFHQDFFDPRMLAVAGIIASGFGYFWLISRFVLTLTFSRGLPCMVWAFAAAFPLRQITLAVLDATMSHEAQVLLAMALPVIAALMLGRNAPHRRFRR